MCSLVPLRLSSGRCRRELRYSQITFTYRERWFFFVPEIIRDSGVVRFMLNFGDSIDSKCCGKAEISIHSIRVYNEKRILCKMDENCDSIQNTDKTRYKLAFCGCRRQRAIWIEKNFSNKFHSMWTMFRASAFELSGPIGSWFIICQLSGIICMRQRTTTSALDDETHQKHRKPWKRGLSVPFSFVLLIYSVFWVWCFGLSGSQRERLIRNTIHQTTLFIVFVRSLNGKLIKGRQLARVATNHQRHIDKQTTIW